MAKYLLNRSFAVIGIYGEFCRKRDDVIKKYVLSYYPRIPTSPYLMGNTSTVDAIRRARLETYPRSLSNKHGDFNRLSEGYLYTCASTVTDIIPVQVIEEYYGMNPSASIEQAAIDLKAQTDCIHTVGYIMRYLFTYFRNFPDGYYFRTLNKNSYMPGEIVRVFPCKNIFMPYNER